MTIAKEMRSAATWPDVTPCLKNDALERGADAVEALVVALREARQAIPGDDYYKVRPKIDAALALSRKGG